ncbi:MAG: PKD domain-containing protein [Nanoarchaeota archaeon]|nr:PKD domain-containing protein [Nanoarchaeota archaeon]
MRKKELIGFVVFVLMICLVSAEFEVDESSSMIEVRYYEGDLVQGRVNMSFSGQDNVGFESNFDGGIGLLELLEKMNYSLGRDFTCNPASCESGYQTLTGSETKTINLNNKKTYGLKIKEDEYLINETREFRFSVFTDDVISCNNTLFIDLFDDGTIDFYNIVAKGYDCPYYEKDFGCFEEEDVTRQATVASDIYYCELVKNLPPAPAYKIGAIVDKIGPGSLGFALIPLQDGWDSYVEGVNATVPLGQDIDTSVVVDYSSIERFDALVCVWTSHEGSFLINMNENDGNTCGANYLYGQEVVIEDMDIDYEIYAIPKAYSAVGDVLFDKDIYEDMTERDLLSDIDNYLATAHGNNCSGEGCVILFSVWGRGYSPNNNYSYIDQNIHSAYLRYKRQDGLLPTADGKIYELREIPSKINSEAYLVLDVEKMEFEVPNSDGKYTFELRLDGEEIIDERIDVDIGFGFYVVPRFAFVGRETAFTADTQFNVSFSAWNFGDGSSTVYSSDNSAKHTYTAEGNFVVTTTLTKSSGSNSTKRFKVVVGEAKTSAELTLKDYESRIANLQSEINNFSDWIKPSIESVLGFSLIKTVVSSKRSEFELKVNSTDAVDEDYVQIVNSLMSLTVPYSIFVSESGSLPALVGFDGINVGHIKSLSTLISGADNEKIKANIIAWMSQNYDVSVDFKTVSAFGEFDTLNFLRIYNINIVQKPGKAENISFLIIDKPNSTMVFKSQIGVKETINGGTYLKIYGSNPLSDVEFLVIGSGAPNVADLGVYISPALGALGITNKTIRQGCWYCDPEGYFNWNRFFIGSVILITMTLGVYIILQSWYKRYYEKHLFKNPNDLYNLINFLYNSRKVGLKDSRTRNKLLERKWTGEQIRYAFRKIQGKRTGMFEIPLFKFIENRKVRKEIEKKQGRPVDTRFIKRPNL